MSQPIAIEVRKQREVRRRRLSPAAVTAFILADDNSILAGEPYHSAAFQRWPCDLGLAIHCRDSLTERVQGISVEEVGTAEMVTIDLKVPEGLGMRQNGGRLPHVQQSRVLNVFQSCAYYSTDKSLLASRQPSSI